MKKTKVAAGLDGLREEDPKKFVSLVRLAWPDIKAALDRGHSVKVIHDRFVNGGPRISYRLFAMYVGQLRRESSERRAGPVTSVPDIWSEDAITRDRRSAPSPGSESHIALVRFQSGGCSVQKPRPSIWVFTRER